MDKSVTFAVAGSGKTAGIVDNLDLRRRVALITYTTNTYDDLRLRVINKFGYIPANIHLSTYFVFLNRFCYRPYLFGAVRDKGISFDAPTRFSSSFLARDINRYLDSGRRLYHCRLAKLLEIKECIPDLLRRLERYYDAVFVDEVQDFGGHDFNLLMHLSAARVEWGLVGDFFQYTYSTSHDGNVNKSLHDDYGRYRQRFRDAGFRVNTESLIHSHRCTATVCSFIREHIGIDIQPATKRTSVVEIVENQSAADRLHSDPSIVKLFFQRHTDYGCHSLTWGAAKGLDHHNDVCVVLNGVTWRQYQSGQLRNLASVTRNKLYVACSRARRHLYLAPETLFRKFRRVSNVHEYPN